jgi:hypothetical protein
MVMSNRGARAVRSSGPTTTRSQQESLFRLKLLAWLLIGALLIAGSIFWRITAVEKAEKLLIFRLGQNIAAATPGQTKTLADDVIALISGTNQNDVLGADLLRDLGIAIVISVIVTFSIEKYSSDRLREHIAYDVLSAAYSKVIPDQVYMQIADNVFRSRVYRRNWEVHIGARPQSLAPNGTAVITAAYSYDVENLNEHRIPFEVVASVDLDDPPPDNAVPKFISFSVRDERDQPLVQAADADALMNRPSATIPLDQPLRKGNVVLQRDAMEMTVTADVKIPARRSITVNFQVERAIRVPGYYVLSAPHPADGMKIIIGVEGFRLTVVPLHPDRGALRNPQRDTWEFDAALLPWQGFRFTAEKI